MLSDAGNICVDRKKKAFSFCSSISLFLIRETDHSIDALASCWHWEMMLALTDLWMFRSNFLLPVSLKCYRTWNKHVVQYHLTLSPGMTRLFSIWTGNPSDRIAWLGVLNSVLGNRKLEEYGQEMYILYGPLIYNVILCWWHIPPLW
jgi:hypothetical protein